MKKLLQRRTFLYNFIQVWKAQTTMVSQLSERTQKIVILPSNGSVLKKTVFLSCMVAIHLTNQTTGKRSRNEL